MKLNETYKHWQTIIERQQSSGLSTLKFCSQENIPHQKFRYYKERLILKTKISENKKGAFSPVILKEKCHSESAIKITYPNGVECTIPESVGSALLSKIIQEIALC